MAVNKEKTYYKAVRRAISTVNSLTTLKEKLDTIVRGTAISMKSSASLLLLDSNRTKLIHSSSWGLPQFYLRKGLLDADKSLCEAATGQPVVIADATNDSRIQYPEATAKAGIVSILGVPVMLDDLAAGSIRVYSRDFRDFTNQDISFVTTMANLVAIGLRNGSLPREKETTRSIMSVTPVNPAMLRRARSVAFAHPSEEDFAQILDFYNIEWVYEPRSFALRWDGDTVTEMFTPDFYLPAQDLYIELTTSRQSLVTHKNRKLRCLKKLYPEVRITLLYKNDYDRLLAKYGCGPLAQTRAHSISRILYSATEIEDRVRMLA